MMDLPPTVCEDYKEHAAIVMYHVHNGNTKQLGALYQKTTLDKDRKVLHKALDYEKNKVQISPAIFSVQIYKECLESKSHAR